MDAQLPAAVQQKLDLVRTRLASLDDAVVAFSGGVDSTLLLHLAVEALGDRVLAVTALSPSFPPWERDEVESLVRLLGASHQIIELREVEREEFAANPPDRCYFCKRELFSALARVGVGHTLMFGANADDFTGDFRPGHRAAVEHAVIAPLAEAGLDKESIREISRVVGLPTWNKPQLACLASRFPYGTRITTPRLVQVAEAESALRDLGFRNVRVRFHDDVGRLEIGEEEFARMLDARTRRAAAAALRGAGFQYAVMDLEGYRSGRLNEALSSPERAAAVATAGKPR